MRSAIPAATLHPYMRLNYLPKKMSAKNSSFNPLPSWKKAVNFRRFPLASAN